MESSDLLIRFEGFAFQPREGTLLRDGEPVELQPKVAAALGVLLQRPGRLFTKEELLDALWPGIAVQEGSLSQVIRKLRVALDDAQDEPRYIQTVYKRGFRFMGEVSVETISERSRGTTTLGPPGAAIESSTTVGDAPLAAVATPRAEGRGRRPLAARVALAAAVAGVIVTAFMVLRAVHRQTPGAFLPGRLRERRLTSSPAREHDADLSADGRSFVFVANQDDGQYDLFVGLLGGSSFVRLTHTPADEYSPRFSPDGTRVAFCRFTPGRDQPGIWTVSALGGDERLVEPNAHAPAWSPRGDEIAFVSELPAGGVAIVRRRLDGGGERRVVVPPEAPEALAWSPDGKTIAFAGRTRLWLVPAPGGAAHQVGEDTENMRGLAWDPEGAALLCDANWGGRANLWWVPLSAGVAQAITAGSGGIYHPSISRDRGRILYTQEFQHQELVRVNAQGRAPAAVPIKGTFDCFDVAPVAGLVAYRDFDAGPRAEAIVVADLATLTSRTVLGHATEIGCPAFSPDGRWLAFADGHRGRALLTVELASGALTRLELPAGAAVVDAPAWAPDGRTMALRIDRDGAGGALAIADLSSASVTVVVPAAIDAPSWSPDGRWIAGFGVDCESSRGLELVDARTWSHRNIAKIESYEARPAWTDDSRAVRILVDERRHAGLQEVTRDGAFGERIALESLADRSFWGVFEVRPAPGGGWLFMQIHYESDLYLLESPDAPAAR